MASNFFRLSRQNKANVQQQPAQAKRANVVMSAMVEIGIKLLKNKSASEVARFLTEAGVPVRVITRVLLRPDLRRNFKSQRFA
jgi:hypothetical protein